LFNLKGPISMKFNRIIKVKNTSLSNIKKQLQNSEIDPFIIKEEFQEKISEGKFPHSIITEKLQDKISKGEFSPSIIREELQDKISEGKFPRSVIREELQDKISEGEFSRPVIQEEFQDKISGGKFAPAVIREEFQDKISESKFFDSFTGEGFRKPFQSLSGVDFEMPFDPVSDEGFFPRVGIYERQLSNDVDIDIVDKVINSDLIEFDISELPRIPYGVASRIESLNDTEFSDFSFGDRRPFLSNFLEDEIANLTETE
ncbi:MAG: hypothetical protein AAGA80_20640, partial [Cyanobacteria bacterium P01_F01_bin.143]